MSSEERRLEHLAYSIFDGEVYAAYPTAEDVLQCIAIKSSWSISPAVREAKLMSKCASSVTWYTVFPSQNTSKLERSA